MICPNCGLDNPSTARFCGNCGTTLTGAAPPPPPPPNPPYNPAGAPYNQASQPYNMAGGYSAGGTRMTPARAIGIGCLILVLLFFFSMLACSRACFRFGRHSYIHRTF